MHELLLTSIFTNSARDLIAGYEYFLVPLYLLVFYFITKIIIWKFYNNAPYKKFILPGVFLKIIGGLFVCFVYNYYYHGGDTFAYYKDANKISNIIIQDPIAGIEILFSPAGDLPKEYQTIISQMTYANSKDTYMIVRITTVLQLFAFNSFMLTSMVFGFLSFWAVLRLYIFFVELYPDFYKPLAYSLLFIPSVLAWGSGILKDTITLSCLCLLVVALYKIVIQKKGSLAYLIIAIISMYLLLVIKAYILIAVIPPIFLLKTHELKTRIKNKIARLLVTPLLLLFFISLAVLAVTVLGSLTAGNAYDVNNLLEKSRIQREYLLGMSNRDNGSGYSLGEFGNNPFELLLKAPAAINVTFFRPYIWESNNIVMLLSAIESLGFLIITIYCLTKYGFMRSFKEVQRDPVIIFCLVFALTFGFFVGISTYNFGSLVRYKIPALPFYLTAMFLIYNKKKLLFANTNGSSVC